MALKTTYIRDEHIKYSNQQSSYESWSKMKKLLTIAEKKRKKKTSIQRSTDEHESQYSVESMREVAKQKLHFHTKIMSHIKLCLIRKREQSEVVVLPSPPPSRLHNSPLIKGCLYLKFSCTILGWHSFFYMPSIISLFFFFSFFDANRSFSQWCY